jgi:hypothetical protein
MPSSPHGLSADSNRPRQRGERTNSRQARGRSTSRGGEKVEPMTTEVKIGAVRLLHTLLSDYHTPLPSLMTLVIPTPIPTHFEKTQRTLIRTCFA